MPFVFAYGSNMDLDHLKDWISRWLRSNRGKQCNIVSARRALLDDRRTHSSEANLRPRARFSFK